MSDRDHSEWRLGTVGQELYEQILGERFDLLIDADHDGSITTADAEPLGDRALSVLGVDRDSPQGKAVLEGARTFWTNLAAAVDWDENGRISRTEYLKAL